jgi:hypothetical protein
MRTFAPTLAVVAALMWPAAASAQSLAEVAQREAARRKAGASDPAKPSAAAKPVSELAASQEQTQPESETSGDVSLAEVARREAARRKALAASGKRGTLLTNQDVKKWEPSAEAGPAGTSEAAPESGKARDDKSSAKPTDAQKDSADAGKGEDFWHGRITSAREELRRNEAFAEALQSRINALSAEFSAKDDPYQRAQVADDRQKALAELDRLTADIDNNKKAIADIEEDARRAGVPAGWIR